MKKIKVGIIGYGYWGPNVVRNFNDNHQMEVVKVCDLSKERLEQVKKKHRNISTTSCPDDILKDKKTDVVAIVTPVSTHYQLAKKALENGKSIFIEKPFTINVAEAENLIKIANKNNLLIMVDHTFLFTPAVKRIKSIIHEGVLGKLYYYDSVRINLGLLQHDINVIWDLVPHDISVMNYLIGNLRPLTVNAVGMSHFDNKMEDIAYLAVKFEHNFIAHFHVNWLSPVKIRQTLIAGNKKMLVWDDLNQDEKLKVYDKGVNVNSREGVYKLLVSYRSGDMICPKIDNTEALQTETQYFVDCLLNNKKPINDGESGLNVVRILEASSLSLKEGGREISIS